MGGQLKRTTSGAQQSSPDAAIMRTILATLVAIFIAATLISKQPTQSAPFVADTGVDPTKVTQNVPKEKPAEKAKPVAPKQPVKPPAKKKAPQQKPQPKPVAGSCELANNYSWPQATARAICLAESSGIASRDNFNDVHRNADGSVRCVGSYGLMQVACFWAPYYGYAVSDLYNPRINMEIAHKIYKRSGFSPWTTYTSGLYLQHL